MSSAGRRISVAMLVTSMVLIGGLRPVPSRATTPPPSGMNNVSGTNSDNDAAQPYRGGRTRPNVSIGNASVREGTTGRSTLSFKVTMSDTSSNDVTVSYATAAGTAAPSIDYVQASGKLTVPAGKTSGTIPVRVVGDKFLERDETMYVTLSKPIGAYISTAKGRGLIKNDDTGVRVSGNLSRGSVHSGGRFSPSAAATYLTVSLFKKKNGVFVRVGRHRVTLAKAGDLDGDGIPDARYTTVWFGKPHGTYRVIAKFLGNTSFRGCSAAHGFKG
jgi:hypothetical protein